MEWSWLDPERDEPTKWWTIDPKTGEPDGNDSQRSYCLGDSALEAVGEAADNIATTFFMKGFTDEGISALVMKRVVPSSFKGSREDAAELLDLIDGLWEAVESYFQQALGRLPNSVERQWLYAFAFRVLRARQNAG